MAPGLVGGTGCTETTSSGPIPGAWIRARAWVNSRYELGSRRTGYREYTPPPLTPNLGSMTA